ncbi:MAG: UbiA family prenyltransferase [Opitutaceae bacterium]|nr:UbiA family prenyltransferase [Opitutaceae bacterium]
MSKQGIKVVICDLDKTLCVHDTFILALLCLMRRSPWELTKAFFLSFRGWSTFKNKVFADARLEPDQLVWNESVLSRVKTCRETGVSVVLLTASPNPLAVKVAQHIGLFDLAVGSERENLKGSRKLNWIRAHYGDLPFEYIGDSRADGPIWNAASSVVYVGHSPEIARGYVSEGAGFEHLAPNYGRPSLNAWLAALRWKQWAKNLLVFVPLVTSHSFSAPAFAGAGLAFALFSICASLGYVLNDLLDIISDSQHPRKRKRPFASGQLEPLSGLLLFAILGVTAAAGLSLLPATSATAVVIYTVTSFLYSLFLKRIATLDLFILAGFYLVRIIAAAGTIGVELSHWLLAFSTFAFLSLASLKRSTELLRIRQAKGKINESRGYTLEHLETTRIFGIGSALISSLVFCLYLDSSTVRGLYLQPEWLWFNLPIYLFWFARLWNLQPTMPTIEDPFSFILKDWVSYVCGGLMIWLFALSV